MIHGFKLMCIDLQRQRLPFFPTNDLSLITKHDKVSHLTSFDYSQKHSTVRQWLQWGCYISLEIIWFYCPLFIFIEFINSEKQFGYQFILTEFLKCFLKSIYIASNTFTTSLYCAYYISNQPMVAKKYFNSKQS